MIVHRIADEPETKDFLSPRQREILDLVYVGKSNPEIGAVLGIAHQTVRNHVREVLHKLGAPNRQSAVYTALQKGLLKVERR